MNFSAKLKSNQNPNYIFNFNIDIPLKYKSSFTHRSNQTSPSKSPAKLNQKKYKLSSITPRPVANVIANKKNEKSTGKSTKKNNKIPKTMKQQFLQKDFFYHPQKKQQPSISRKTQKIISNKKSNLKQQICPSRRTVKNSISNNQTNSQILSHKNVIRNISILQKLVTDDHNIKYTTDSSQVKQTQPSSNLQINAVLFKYSNKQKRDGTYDKSLRIGTINEQFNLDEIRQYQQIATQRKQKLNYEYLREKILLEASVKKIQRAWRKYMTKKLVNSYSSTIASKLVNNYVISSARSQPRSFTFHKNKKLFKSNQLYATTNRVDQIISLQKFKQNQEYESNESSENQSEKLNFKIINKTPFQKKSTFQNAKVEKTFFAEQKKSSKSIKKNKSQKSLSSSSSYKTNNKVFPKQLNFSEQQVIVLQNSVPSQNFMTHSGPQTKEIQLKQEQFLMQREIQQKLKKFQQQQIRKWESILDSIKKGKNIQVLLQKSQKYKKQLQNNLKLINLSSIRKNIQKNRASPIIFQQKKQLPLKSSTNQCDLSKSYLSKISNDYNLPTQNNQQTQNDLSLLHAHQTSPLSPSNKIPSKQISSEHQLHKKQQKQQQLNETGQKRRQKIMFFQNQILKIDNQQYSDMSSVSCQSFNNYYGQEKDNYDRNQNGSNQLEQREREENLKLRKKLELFNTHFLDISSEEGLTDRSLKGLKGNSTDERRNSINKRMNKFSQQQNSRAQIQQQKQQPSSQQGRKYRRPDIQVKIQQPRNQSLKLGRLQKSHFNKLQSLINKRIQYNEEDQEQQYNENLPHNKGLYKQNEKQSLKERDQYHVDSQQQSEIQSQGIDFEGHQKHFNTDYIHHEPVLTHRDRRYQVPELKLQNLPKSIDTSIVHRDPNNKQQISIQESYQQSQSQRTIQQVQCRQKQNLSKQENKKQSIQLKNKTLQEQIKQKQNEKAIKNITKMPKVDMKQILKICSYLEEQLIYEGLLQFSDSDRIVQSIKGLFDSYKKDKKKVKPQGICTNLQSIKDYLQNFVGFIFQNKMSSQVEKALWTASGPKVVDLLKYLRRGSDYETDQNQYIMNIDIFQKHWKYANSNIYFDKKYNDEKTENQRVVYLKGLTRVYFRAIFDAFNQSLQFQRIYGLIGHPYPWCNRIARQDRKTLKTAFQQAYRRILKISVVYYGVHFDDKSHLFNQQSIKQLQQERLLTLLMMQLQQDEYRWNFIEDQSAEVKYDISLLIQKLVLQQFLFQFKEILQGPKR